MNAGSDGSVPPAEEIGVSVEEAELFLAEQSRFGRVVGKLRDRYPDRFAHASVLHDPPSFLVRFVGGRRAT